MAKNTIFPSWFVVTTYLVGGENSYVCANQSKNSIAKSSMEMNNRLIKSQDVI
jgi:hypothetical protein